MVPRVELANGKLVWVPLWLVIPGVGLIGGLAGGLAGGLLFVVWAAIESGGADVPLILIVFGLWWGFLVGTAMGVLATVLRLVALALRTGMKGELVAVAIGAVVTPFAFIAALGGSGWELRPVLIATVLGGLAALQFCRTVLKRHRAAASDRPGD